MRVTRRGGRSTIPQADSQVGGLEGLAIGKQGQVLVFFSNRAGCLWSLLISLIGTLILLVALGVVR
jgi:hypothetical protein